VLLPAAGARAAGAWRARRCDRGRSECRSRRAGTQYTDAPVSCCWRLHRRRTGRLPPRWTSATRRRTPSPPSRSCCWPGQSLCRLLRRCAARPCCVRCFVRPTRPRRLALSASSKRRLQRPQASSWPTWPTARAPSVWQPRNCAARLADQRSAAARTPAVRAAPQRAAAPTTTAPRPRRTRPRLTRSAPHERSRLRRSRHQCYGLMNPAPHRDRVPSVLS
jgi:hypothetical protein